MAQQTLATPILAVTTAPAGHARNRSLDGVRAGAISLVLLSHSDLHGTHGGWTGVDLFFVLSGFLITGLLATEWEKTGQIRLGRFYRNRAVRLYPALIFVVLLGIPFFRVLGDGKTAVGYGRTSAFALTYTEDLVYGATGFPHGGLGSTWSLAIEEQFYLLWPLILIFLFRRRRSALPVALGLAGLSTVALWLFTRPNPSTVPNTYYRPDTHSAAILMGCAVALAVRSGVGARLVRFAPAVGVFAALAFLAMTGLAGNYPRNGYLVVWLPASALIGSALVWALAVAPDRGLARPLSWRPVTAVGRWSYSIYLLFLPILQVVDYYSQRPHTTNLAISLVLVLGLGWASYECVEGVSRTLRRRLDARDRMTAAT